jgi:hypothetical protein
MCLAACYDTVAFNAGYRVLQNLSPKRMTTFEKILHSVSHILHLHSDIPAQNAEHQILRMLDM